MAGNFRRELIFVILQSQKFPSTPIATTIMCTEGGPTEGVAKTSWQRSEC